MPTNSRVVKRGRIICIDPTEFSEYKITENGRVSEGVILDNISWNQEDLQFSVDLRVVNPDRLGSKLPIYQNTNNVSETKFTSFMSGKDFNDESNYLTDSYTDITFQEVSARGESQKEALGIDSIDINFDSHFFPLVNIKFTDVRAAALFGPTDNEYVHNKRIEAIINDKNLDEDEKRKKISEENGKMSSSFFKSLFHFPYPRFMLTVMGYYGEKVTFQLAVNDFKTSFNSTNGNFDVSVSFIGYMYGLYTDLPMSLIFTAPYYNRNYWDKSIENGRFCYTDNQPIMTFIEYLRVYYELKKGDNEDAFNNSNVLKIYKKLNDIKNSLEDISEAFDIFDAQFTTNTSSIGVYHDPEEENPKAFILSQSSLKYDLIKSKYTNLYNAVTFYNENYADENNRLSLKIFKDQKLDEDSVRFELHDTNDVITEKTNIQEVDNLIDKLNKTNREIPNIKGKSLNQNNQPMYSYIYGNFLTYYRGDFKDEIKSRHALVTSELESRQKETDEEMLKLIEKKLKFKPTIENVFRMIFAHIDTFINALDVNVLENINSSISNGSNKRRSDYLGLTDKNSDLPKNCRGDMTVPPFPLCKDEQKHEYQYPGMFFTRGGDNINYIDEVNFVEKIVEGIKTFNDDANQVKNLIESLSNTEDSSFDLLSVTDILYNDVNPYISLREMLKRVQNDKSKACYIEYFIFSRMIMYGISNASLQNASFKNKISDLVNLDFNNFKKAGIEINRNTKSFLTNGHQYRIDTNTFTYTNDGFDKNGNFKFKSNLCYFPKNAFNKDDDENKFATSEEKTFLQLGKEYKEIIKKIEEKDLERDTKDKFIKTKYTEETRTEKFKSSYLMSYITLSSEKKNNIGFAKKYDSFELPNMYDDFTRNGEVELYKYNAGVLQIGEKRSQYIKKNNNIESFKNVKIDDIYLGINLNDNEKKNIDDVDKNKPVMSLQTNPYFKAFLLLGSLSSYLNFSEILSSSNKAEIFKFSKVLYLYYGACIYFRRKEHKNFNTDGIVIDNSFSLTNLPSYIIDKGSDKDDIIDENYGTSKKVWTFTNRKTHLFLCNGKSEDCFSFNLTKVELDDTEKYFINWVLSEEFKQIDETLSSNGNVENEEIKNNNNKDHVYFLTRTPSSSEDLCIKKLLCEDLYIYKRPNYNLSFSKEFSYSNEYIDAIKNVFKDYKTEEEIKEEERKEEERKVTDISEVKKALYYTLKRLYDKWLCCYNLGKPEEVADRFLLNHPSQDKQNRELRYTTNSDKNVSTEFNSFIFVDSFYRDISDKFLVDPDTIKQLAESYSNADIMNSNASVFEFMNEIAEKNGLLFASLPIYSNFYDVNTIANIFSPNKKYDCSNLGKSDIPGNTYVIMYTGEASSKLDFGQEGEYDDDGITSIEDIYQSSQDQVPSSLSDIQDLIKEGDGDELNFVVPVFCVTFGKQNQMYFKNITVNMDNPKVTDYSIANLIQISQGGKHGDSDGYDVGIGQDLYSIYANRSYTCTVEMLGCINIMPMMYFQLNNIPMFRGLYIIINVSHNITPGNMTTKFTGVRVSKNHIGLVKTTFTYQGLDDKINSEGISVSFNNNENEKSISIGQKSTNQIPSKKISDDWLKNVETMGEWYEKNIHTYQGGALNDPKGYKLYYVCPLIGDTTVSDDCSGFVKACLQAQGISALDNILVNTTSMQPGGKFEEILKENGFERLNYSETEQKQGDIIIGGPHSHTEIYWTPKLSYSWGNIHDINRSPGMPYYRYKMNYKYIYRKK